MFYKFTIQENNLKFFIPMFVFQIKVAERDQRLQIETKDVTLELTPGTPE